MKRTILYTLFFAIMAMCGDKTNASEVIAPPSGEAVMQQKNVQSSQPLNLIVLLDLSDRLVHNNIVSQKDNDIDIIKYLLGKFEYNSYHPGPLMKCKNHFQIIFYPSPSGLPQISNLAKQMNVDLAPLVPGAKKQELKDAKTNIPSALSKVYDVTIKNKNWVGCDIWGFFSYGQIDNQCIRDGYRNVLVILTDGYIFHVANRQKQGNSYSYILPQTLRVAGSGLINGRNKTLPSLSNLEVLMLEVNPYDIKDYPKMQNIIGSWLSAMGVTRYQIATTDLPSNITPIIDNFIKW